MSGLLAASTEPHALSYYSTQTSAGVELGLVDVGAANDPQSAAEALEQWPLDNEVVVPVLANRWDRPLRAVVFAGAVLGRFPVVGVSGSLFEWVKRLKPEELSDVRREYRHTKVFRLTRSLSRDPDRLARLLTVLLGTPESGRFVLVIVENTHDPHTDRLRQTFARVGRPHLLEFAD